MISINKASIKMYITVMLVTAVFLTLFLVGANKNANIEQTYEVTDHTINTQYVDSEQNERTTTNDNDQKSEQPSSHKEEHLVMASAQ
ncbi:DNA damage-induced cell division inhibitor SosA [Staphylococcus auricularis]|uniref:DNA damage-induced cell division inhibitor SosA n=1 Tax=Staphylococcus auricularis TaxID=29379 RepID=UPI00242A35AE|nr:DNA damage-induced cell division inhibitor SosA [Staphylococcus auricularis]